MKHTFYFLTFFTCGILFFSCNSNQSNTVSSGNNSPSATKSTADSDKGIGRFKHVPLTHPLDDSMVARGSVIFNSKCISCHKLTEEKLVGPGWKNITDRRTPEWIMNFITNTNVMLDSDLVAQQLMVTCITRMPNQNLSDDQARAILEFMRHNDGKK